jgi:hypothetical protein
VIRFKLLSKRLAGGNEENIRIVSVLTEILLIDVKFS